MVVLQNNKMWNLSLVGIAESVVLASFDIDNIYLLVFITSILAGSVMVPEEEFRHAECCAIVPKSEFKHARCTTVRQNSGTFGAF